MHGLQGVRPVRKQGDHRQEQGENILHKEQRSRSLNVVDDPPPLRDDAGHGGKVVVQQHETAQLAGSLRAGTEGNGAVRLLHGKQIVDAVAGHGHGVPLLLQRRHQAALLFRRHPAENRVFRHRMGKILVGFQRGGVNIPVCTGNACPGGDQAGGMGIVAGYDLHSHALTVKIAEGLSRLLPDAAAEQDQRKGRYQHRVQPAGDGVAVIPGGQQHAAALLRPAVHGVPVFLVPLRQNEFRRAHQKRALPREHRPAPLGLRGEGDAFFADPVGFAVKQLVNGPARGVVRL